MLCALARLARLAKRVECFQAFYYLLTEAGAELCSHPRTVLEIQEHVWALWDTVTKSDEPVSSLRWCAVRTPLVSP